jgi:hypothetical protein
MAKVEIRIWTPPINKGTVDNQSVQKRKEKS